MRVCHTVSKSFHPCDVVVSVLLQQAVIHLAVALNQVADLGVCQIPRIHLLGLEPVVGKVHLAELHSDPSLLRSWLPQGSSAVLAEVHEAITTCSG